MRSTEISAEYCALPASRLYARGDCFLYGYYNSNQHLIQVKICTAVDKDKEINIFCSLNNCSTMSKKIF